MCVSDCCPSHAHDFLRAHIVWTRVSNRVILILLPYRKEECYPIQSPTGCRVHQSIVLRSTRKDLQKKDLKNHTHHTFDSSVACYMRLSVFCILNDALCLSYSSSTPIILVHPFGLDSFYELMEVSSTSNDD